MKLETKEFETKMQKTLASLATDFEEGMRREGLDFVKHNVAINVRNT